jgi:signal transduction histidine kinase
MSKEKRSAKFNYLAFILSSLFLLSLAIFSLIWFQKQKETENWVTHTYRVKLKIEQSFGLLLEAESNQRGWLLTKDSSYLIKINRAETQLHSSLRQLDSLIADNARQVQNAQNLRLLALSRIERLHSIMDSSQKLNSPSVGHFFSPGKMKMDSIYDQVKLMQAEEDGLMGKRTFVKQIQDDRVITFIVLFSFIAFAILMWSFFKIRNESALHLKAQLEIIAINELLNDRNDMLERKNRDLTSFTNIASHDLKEPLRKIQMFTNLIVDSEHTYLNSKSFEYFNKISQQSKRMQILIESVLQYAQSDEDEFGFQLTDLNEITHLAIEDLSEIIKEKNADIEVQSLPTVFCSPNQMEQLFINLIDNGIKYARPNLTPSIKINATRLDETWKIDFYDNGIGFDETYSNKIFEIFQRLHSTDEYPGTGIGLAICKKIVENHRGRITVRSVLGEGSVFSVILPIYDTKKSGFTGR